MPPLAPWLALALVAIAIFGWIASDQLVLVLVGLLAALKSIKLGKVMIGAWAVLTPLLKRFLVLEIPKKVLMGLAWIGLGAEARRWLRTRIRRIKAWLRRLRRRIERRFRWLAGRRIAFIISIVVTLVIFLAGFFGFGVYFVWWVGAVRIPAGIAALGTALWRMGANIVFKSVAFLHLDRAWRFLHDRFPRSWIARYRLAKWRFLRATSKGGATALKRIRGSVTRKPDDEPTG